MKRKNIVTNTKEASAALTSANYLSSRLDSFFDKYTGPHVEAVKNVNDFLSSWPMYSDGADHLKSRTIIVDSIKGCSVVSKSISCDIASSLAKMNNITSDNLDDLVTVWHQKYFGIDKKQYNAIVDLSNALDKFFPSDINEDWKPLDIIERLDTARGLFELANYTEGSFLFNCNMRNLSTDLCIALATDSIYPTRASLGSILHLFCTATPEYRTSTSPREAVVNALFTAPPFRFIGRIKSPIDIPEPERVSIDILSCHRTSESETNTGKRNATSLSFGKGKHACPGANPAIVLFTEVWKHVQKSWELKEIEYNFGQFNTSKGKCEYVDQVISIRECT